MGVFIFLINTKEVLQQTLFLHWIVYIVYAFLIHLH